MRKKNEKLEICEEKMRSGKNGKETRCKRSKEKGRGEKREGRDKENRGGGWKEGRLEEITVGTRERREGGS